MIFKVLLMIYENSVLRQWQYMESQDTTTKEFQSDLKSEVFISLMNYFEISEGSEAESDLEDFLDSLFAKKAPDSFKGYYFEFITVD